MSTYQAYTTPKEKRWSHAEIDSLHELCESLSVIELSIHLKRSIDSINEMLEQFGLKAKSEKKRANEKRIFTPEEDRYIIQSWPTHSTRLLALHLNVHKDTLAQRVNQLGLPKKTKQQLAALRNHPFTEEEDQYIRSNWRSKTYREISAFLQRSKRSIEARRGELGLSRTPEQILEDRRIKKDIYAESHAKDWSDSDVQYLRDNWATTLCRDLATQLGRNMSSIRVKAKRLNLSGNYQERMQLYQSTKPEAYKGRRVFTPIEDEFIIKNWSTKSKKSIASELNRPTESVESRGRILGLTGKAPDRKKREEKTRSLTFEEVRSRSAARTWTPEENQYLRDNWTTKSMRQLAEELKRPSVNSIHHQARKLGIDRKTKVEIEAIHYSLFSIPTSLAASYFTKDQVLQEEIKGDAELSKLLKIKQGEVLLKRIVRKQSA